VACATTVPWNSAHPGGHADTARAPPTTAKLRTCRTSKRLAPPPARCLLRSYPRRCAGWRRPRTPFCAAWPRETLGLCALPGPEPLALLHRCAVWHWRHAGWWRAQALHAGAYSRPLAAAPARHPHDRHRQSGSGWLVGVRRVCAEVPVEPVPLTGRDTGRDRCLTAVLLRADGAQVAIPLSDRTREQPRGKAHWRVSCGKTGSQRWCTGVAHGGQKQQTGRR
jgi:hypothetical protein